MSKPFSLTFKPREDEQELVAQGVLEAARARLATDSYYEFVKQAFTVLRPGKKYLDNWHIQYLCNTMESVVRSVGEGKPRNKHVAINVPPRSMKSLICSVCIVPWAWIHYPQLRFICSSYSGSVSTDLSVSSRFLIESDWYQRYWGDRFQMMPDNNQKMSWSNTATGVRNSVSTTGSTTGKGADIIIIDDPQDPRRADSDTERQKCIDHYDQTLSTRLDDADIGIMVLVQQRLHHADLTGHVLKNEPDSWFHICLPSDIDPSDTVKPERLRSLYVDGLLWPSKFPKAFLDWMAGKGTGDYDGENRIGGSAYQGQFKQRPVKDGGDVWDTAWFGRFSHNELPAGYVVEFYSDTAYTDNQENDPCVIVAYTRVQDRFYILGISRRWLTFPQYIKHLPEWSAEMGRSRLSMIRVEPKATGKSVVQTLKNVQGINIVEARVPVGKKVERAKAVSPIIETGKVLLPHDSDPKFGGTWIGVFLAEVSEFPKTTHDDQVDCVSGILSERHLKPARL